jgi:hypothetical protein
MAMPIQTETAAEATLRELNKRIEELSQKLQDNTVEVFFLETALQRRREAAVLLEREIEEFERIRGEARRIVNREIRPAPVQPIRIMQFEECESGVRSLESAVSEVAA